MISSQRKPILQEPGVAYDSIKSFTLLFRTQLLFLLLAALFFLLHEARLLTFSCHKSGNQISAFIITSDATTRRLKGSTLGETKEEHRRRDRGWVQSRHRKNEACVRTPARDKNNNRDYFRPSQTHKELLQQTESEFMAQLVVVSALGVDTPTYCTLQHTGPLLQKRKLVLQCVKRKDKECVCV